MKNKSILEIIISLVLVVLLVVLLNPVGDVMSGGTKMTLAAISVVVFGLYAAFILREKAVDEREEVNRGIAGRVGFLSGAAALLLGIISEILSHHLDNWLIVALVVMIIAKILTALYCDKYF